MAAKQATANPLLVAGRAPDTSLSVQLHPLVLLTISDYITRHTIRQQSGPIIGAVIGQQNGRGYTLEVAFECKLASSGTDDVLLDGDWFSTRLEMYKEVHKDPALDLVALFTLGPAEGPQPAHLPVLQQVQTISNSDSVMLLLFHPEMVDRLQGGKLPITLYESLQEPDGDQVHLRFRELAFEVETSDAEMIGVDFVAKGSGNATAVPTAAASGPGAAFADAMGSADKKKGKGKAKTKDEEADVASSVLSAEDEELITTLQARINAIKMLKERLDLIRSYLTSLPGSNLTSTDSTGPPPPPTTNFTLLRSINALLSRIPLLTPSGDGTTLQPARAAAKQDVQVTSLLAELTRSLTEAQSMGSRYSVLRRERYSKERAQGVGRGMAPVGRPPQFGMPEGLLAGDGDS